MLSLEKAKREEAEKKRRLAEVDKMRQERKKAEQDKEVEKKLEEVNSHMNGIPWAVMDSGFDTR